MRCQSPQLLQQITATANNLGADLFTPWIDTLQVDYLSWEIQIGAGATGTLSFQTTNQPDPNTTTPAVLLAGPASTPALTTAIAGSAVNQLVTTPGLGVGAGSGRYWRLKYARTSGNGIMNVWVTGAAKE